jgi:hypothetical protein
VIEAARAGAARPIGAGRFGGPCDGRGVSEFAGAVAILSSLTEVFEGSFKRLRNHLPRDMQPVGPTAELFTIERGHADAGAAVSVSATRGDGRIVTWLVEAHIYPTDPNEWRVSVKAEIDLDDRDGDRHCILNAQQIVDDSTAAARAIRHAAELLVGYPREDLLADGWEPPEDDS